MRFSSILYPGASILHLLRPWAMVKFGIRLRRPQNLSRRPSGCPKNSLVTSGGPLVEFLGEISPPQGGPEALLGSVLGGPAHSGPPLGDWH